MRLFLTAIAPLSSKWITVKHCGQPRKLTACLWRKSTAEITKSHLRPFAHLLTIYSLHLTRIVKNRTPRRLEKNNETFMTAFFSWSRSNKGECIVKKVNKSLSRWFTTWQACHLDKHEPLSYNIMVTSGEPWRQEESFCDWMGSKNYPHKDPPI